MQAYSSPSVLGTFNPSKCEFQLFFPCVTWFTTNCLMVWNSLMTAPLELYSDNVQWGPLEMFCTTHLFLNDEYELGLPHECTLMDKNGKGYINQTKPELWKPQILWNPKKNTYFLSLRADYISNVLDVIRYLLNKVPMIWHVVVTGNNPLNSCRE